MSFHNTPHLSGDALEQSEADAQKQEAIIQALYSLRPTQNLTPFEVSQLLAGQGKHWPITSIRRAITNLTKQGILEKTEHQRLGEYGVLNYAWKYKVVSQEQQTSLFNAA